MINNRSKLRTGKQLSLRKLSYSEDRIPLRSEKPAYLRSAPGWVEDLHYCFAVILMSRPIQKRRRGVVLTPDGLQKLQAAKSEAEMEYNFGKRYTLEELSDRTGLSVDTLMKVLKCEFGVDKQTLKSCFRAFNLILEARDYFLPAQEGEETVTPELSNQGVELELPGGQVPLNSSFYVERFASRGGTRTSLEAECYKTIVQPGSLIRIKASRLMGKTSLMARILHQAAQQGCRAVSVNFQLADKAVFEDLDRFLRWFCASVCLGVQLPNQLATYWDDLFGSKVSCKIYFEQHLLAKTVEPIVLGLDDIDRLFQYPSLADEFFGLLRTWHEEAKNREIWKKLRLVVAHSTEVYIPLSTNKSPFNVGLPIELPPFTREQVQDLAARHQLEWSMQQAAQLLDFVGGQPHLLRVALYHIQRQDITLEQLFQTFLTSTDIYRDHLQRQLWTLQQQPELLAAMIQVVTADAPVELDLIQAFKLQSMGLVELQGKQARPSCQIYQQYFRSIGGSVGY